MFEYDIVSIERSEFQLGSFFTLKHLGTDEIVRVIIPHHVGLKFKVGDRFVSDYRLTDCNSRQESSTVPSPKM